MQGIKEFWNDLHVKHPNMMGRFYALLAAVGVAFSTLFSKLLSKNVHFLVLASTQLTFGAFFSFILFGMMGMSLYHPDKDISFKLFLRGFIGGMFLLIFIFAIRALPPQKLIVLINSQPIFVIILAAFILNEKIDGKIIGLLILGLSGIIIMIDPYLLVPNSWLPSGAVKNQNEKDYPVYYLVLPIICAIGGAGVAIFLKAFAKNIHAFHNVGYFFTFSAFYCGLASVVVEIPPDRRASSYFDYFAMIMVGASQLMFQMFFSLASKYEARAGFISLLMSFQIPMTYALDLLFLNGRLELLNVIGGMIIMASTILISFSKEQPPASPPIAAEK